MTDGSQREQPSSESPVSQGLFQEAMGMIAAAFERTATKDELAALEARVDEGFGKVDDRFAQVDRRFDQIDRRFQQIDGRFEQLAEQMARDKQEIIFQFQALAENIHQDLAGANRDEISLIHDRVERIEQHLGLTSSR